MEYNYYYMPVDPTQPLPISTIEESENKRNPGWFKPGQSGNPHGRPPKGYSITEMFREMFGADKEKKREFANKIIDAALAGDMAAAKMIWQYMDGMPSQSVDLTSSGETIKTPIHFIPEEIDEVALGDSS